MKKPKPGDIFWWDNPLEKGVDYDTHLLCGRRPVLIINIMRSGYQFIPCTSKELGCRQIQLIGRKNLRFNLKDIINTETDDTRLEGYIGTIDTRTVEAIRSQIGANMLNPYVKSTRLNIDIVNIPLGRLVKNQFNEYYILTNRFGINDITAIPCTVTKLNLENEFYLVDQERDIRYKVCFDKVCRLKKYDHNFELLNGIADGTLQYMIWKIQDVMQEKMIRIQSKYSTLKDEHEKLILENKRLKLNIENLNNELKSPKKKSTQGVKRMGNLQIDLLGNTMTQSLGDNNKLASLLETMNKDKEEETVIPETTTPEPVVEESEEDTTNITEVPITIEGIIESGDTCEDITIEVDNDNHFTNYFSPKTNNVLLREMITCTEDVINFLSESSSDFIQRTGRSYEDWYTLRNDVNESIDWSIAPYEVYGARFIPRQ